MKLWGTYYKGLALIAALCFVVLSGLHVARPVADMIPLSVYGYDTSDICGYGGDGPPRDCPNCTLATGAIAAICVDWFSWRVMSFERVLPTKAIASLSGGAIDAYRARAPPIFT